MVVLYHESSPPCHFFPIASIARLPAIHLHPFPFPWEICAGNTKNIKKYPKIVFDRFSHRVTFRFSILGNQLRKRFQVFLSRFSHSLKISVNEIEVPFANFILIKNGTCRAILLLFTLVKGFEKVSLRYRFMTFSDCTN